MSDKIDQRIVEMSFENQKFEKGIRESKNSLKDFSNALNEMGKGKDFQGLEDSVNTLSRSFSALEQIGIGALRRIGESAIDAGARLIKKLSVDQLSAGLTKYQEKIEAVQTMVSAGYGFDEVEKQMAQLMWFADETSYSFSDMANNAGKFVAAGVNLETSSKAMQGIATWAAHSGKNSQAASIAMFNLAQAISMGYVDTLNWRSIMGQNMNTVMFKQIAIGVAEATGAIKKGQVTIQNFDSNLKTKWFTNDVLVKTLEQYSDYAEKVYEVQQEMNLDTAAQAMEYMDQHAEEYADVLNQIGNAAFKAAQESKSFTDSINATMDAVSTGWMQTYEIIFGTLDEAKENFSQLTEILYAIFAAGAAGRNEMLQGIKDAGGVKNAFQIIKNVALALLTPLKAISEAFDQIFPPKTEKQWVSLLNTLKNLTGRLIMGDEMAENLKRTFAGLFAVVDLGWEVVKLFGNSFLGILRMFVPLGDGLLGITANIGDFLVWLNRIIKSSGFFEYALLGVKVAAILLHDVLTNIVDKIRTFVKGLKDAENPLQYLKTIGEKIFGGIIDYIQLATTWISKNFINALKIVNNFIQNKFGTSTAAIFKAIFDILKEALTFIIDKGGNGLKSFSDAINNLDFNKIATFVTGGVLLMFINQITMLNKSMTGFIDTATGFASNLSKKLFGTTTKIKDLAYMFGILAASIWVLSKIPADELKRALLGLTGAIVLFVAAYGSIQLIASKTSEFADFKSIAKSAFGLIGLATALAIMASAVKKISSIDKGDIVRSVAVVGAMMGFLVAYQALYAVISTIPGQGVMSISLVGMAVGLVALTGLVVILNKISKDGIANGLANLASILLVISAIQILFGLAGRVSGGHKLSASLFSMTAGILAFLLVLKVLNSVGNDEITKGIGNLALIGIVLAGLETLFGLAGRVSGGVKLNSNMAAIQLGMLAMVGLIVILGYVKQSTIDKGIVALAEMARIIIAIELLTALSARIASGSKTQRILGAVALTMLSFVSVIGILSLFDPETVNRGMITLAKMTGIILAIEVLTALVGRFSGGLKSFGLMIGITTAILTLTASLALLAMIDQNMLRNATISLSIASIAVGALAISFSILIKALNTMSLATVNLKGIEKVLLYGFVILGTILIATSGLLMVIKLVSPIIESISGETFNKFIISLGMITALISAFAILSKIQGVGNLGVQLKGLIPAFTGVAGIILATMGLFKALKTVLPIIDSISWESFNKFIIGLGMMSVLMGGIVALTPFLIPLGAGFLPVLGGVAVAIVAVGGIVLAFAGLALILNELVKNSATLQNGISLLISVSKGLGQFIGAFVGGFTIESLTSVGKAIKGFAEAIGGIQPGIFGGIKDLANAVLLISTAEFVGGISRIVNFGKDPMTVFTDQLKHLTSSFDNLSVSDISHSAEILAALVPLTENFKLISLAIKEIPPSGGFKQLFLGNTTIDEFGKQIEDFVKAFRKIEVSDAYKTIDVLTALVPVTVAMSALFPTIEAIPPSGGFKQLFIGNTTIDEFGEQIEDFVKAFRKIELSDAYKTIDILTALVPVTTAMSKLFPAIEAIPPSGGFKQLFSGNTTLDELGKQLAGFAKELKGVDFSIVQPALDSLSKITASFESIGSTTITKATNSFKNDTQLQTAVVSILDTIVKTIESKKKIIIKDFEGVFTSVLSKSNSYIKDFKKLGADIVIGLRRGIEAERASAEQAIKSLMTSLVTTSQKTVDSRSPSKVFETIGGWCTKGLANGITKETKIAVNASANLAKSVEGAIRDGLDIHSEGSLFPNIAKYIPKGLTTGLSKGKNKLLKSAEQLGIDVSKHTTKGVTEGFEGSESGITTIVTDVIDLLSGNTDIAKLSDKFGISIGDNIVSGTNAALSNGKTGLSGTVKETVKTELEKLQNFLEEEKYYGRISLEEELAAYEMLRTNVNLSGEERKKIDREVYRLNKEIYEAQISYISEVTEAEEDAAKKRKDLWEDYQESVEKTRNDAEEKLTDLRKKYDKDVFSAREDAQKKIQSTEKKYQEDYNQILLDAEKDRQKAREDYAAKQKSVNEKLLSDINAQNKAYEDAVKSRADAIYGAYGLFAKVEEDAEVTGVELLQNLRDQGAALSEWEQVLERLEGRGVGTDLIEELQKMGPASKAQIKALLTLTDEQLEEYVGLFQGKYSFARIKAETELEGLKDSTRQAIQDLNAQAAIDLDVLAKEFENTMLSINSTMDQDLKELKRTYEINMDEIRRELNEKLQELKTSFKEAEDEINKELDKKLAEMEKAYNTSLDQINTDVAKKLDSLQKAFGSTMKNVKDLTEKELKTLIEDNRTKLILLEKDTAALLGNVETTYDNSGNRVVSNFNSDMKELDRQTGVNLNMLNSTVQSKLSTTVSEFETTGRNVAAGFAAGIRNGAYLAADAAKYMAQEARFAAEGVLIVDSPSKIFENIGQFVGQGFANGIINYVDQVRSASTQMAQGPIAVVSQAIAQLEGMMDDDLDWSPVITPVLDLSNIKSNALAGILGNNSHYTLAGGSIRIADEINQNGSRNDASGTTIINNFDMTGLVVRSEVDVDAIANKLYQKQQIALRGRGVRTIPAR